MFNSKLYFYATVNVYILESINLSLQIFFYFRGSRINSLNGRKKCSSWSRNKKKDFLQKKYFTEEYLIRRCISTYISWKPIASTVFLFQRIAYKLHGSPSERKKFAIEEQASLRETDFLKIPDKKKSRNEEFNNRT